MRINRIPQAMRKMKMSHLVARHANPEQQSSSAKPSTHIKPTQIASPAKLRGTKRPSDDLRLSADKENSYPTTTVINPKKRKPNPPTTSSIPPPSAIPSSSPATTRSPRKPDQLRQPAEPLTLLSPNSHNSRPQSRASPKKSPPPSSFRFPTAPTSARPATAPTASTTKPARPASRIAKRPEPQQVSSASQLQGDQLRPDSSSSNSSANTTIVHSARKVPTAAGKANTSRVKKDVTAPVTAPAPAPAKKGTIKSAFHSLTGSKRGKAAKEAATAAATATAAPTSTGGRVLRKRA